MIKKIYKNSQNFRGQTPFSAGSAIKEDIFKDRVLHSWG
jgi:hypothetical protein